MCPGHERFVNSLHPIMSFLKKVPPLIDQNEMKEQEMSGPVMPAELPGWFLPSLLPGYSRYITGTLPATMDFAAYRVKVRSVFH